MRPTVISQTGIGTSSPARLNVIQSDFKVGIGAVVSGTATYTIQHSFDDPGDYSSASDYGTNATWFPHEDLAAQTASADGNYAYPVQASRVNITSGTGTVTVTYLQR